MDSEENGYHEGDCYECGERKMVRFLFVGREATYCDECLENISEDVKDFLANKRMEGGV